MEYRGYRAFITFSPEDNCFSGRLAVDTDEDVSFVAFSYEEFEKSFHDVVDRYERNHSFSLR